MAPTRLCSSLSRLPARRVLLLVLCFFVAKSSQDVNQVDFVFVQSPPPTTYGFTGNIVVINCQAVVMVPEGEPQQTVSVQLYRNDTPFSPYPNRAPPRHEALSVDGEVAGVLIDPVLESDQGTVYHCAVVRGGGPVATSDRTTLFVGDGTPYPVSLDQTDQQLYSLTLSWSPAPSPEHYPVLGYTLIFHAPNLDEMFEVAIDGNDTLVLQDNLQPNTAYTVRLAGRNAIGEGRWSDLIVAPTLNSEPPFPPAEVNATANIGNQSSSISVSWNLSNIDPVIMTPVTHYIVFYGTSEPLLNVTTSNNRTNTVTIGNLKQGGNYTVGVAAVNSGGLSETTFFARKIAACPSLPALPHGSIAVQPVWLGGVVGAVPPVLEARYSCDGGFELAGGGGVRTCSLDEFDWSGSDMSCKKLPNFPEGSEPPNFPEGSAMVVIIAASAVGGVIFLAIFIIVILIITFTVTLRRHSGTVPISMHHFDSPELGITQPKKNDAKNGGTALVTARYFPRSHNSSECSSTSITSADIQLDRERQSSLGVATTSFGDGLLRVEGSAHASPRHTGAETSTSPSPHHLHTSTLSPAPNFLSPGDRPTVETFKYREGTPV